MDRRLGGSASRGLLVLLALAAPLALAVALRAMPLPTLDAAGMGWTVAAFATGLVVAAAGATVVALATGLRSGSAASLLLAGAAASLVGGGFGLIVGSGTLATSVAFAAALIGAAAWVERTGMLIHGRGTRVGAAGGLLLSAELAAAIEMLPPTAPLVADVATALQVVAAALAALAALVAAGRDLGPAAGVLAVGAASLALARGPDVGLLFALVILTVAMLLVARSVVAAGAEEGQSTAEVVAEALPPLAGLVSEGVLRFDGHLQLRSWNAAAARLLGLDEASAGSRIEDLLGLALPDLPTAEDETVHHASLRGLGISIRRGAGGITAVVRDAATSSDADQLGRELRGTIEELLAARRTIELQRAEIERAATTDPLTGVASRSAILERLAVEVAQARRYQHPVAIVLVDVDHFGALNGAHGTSGGDEALREVALRVRLRVRAADALGRSGSDAFLAVLPHTDEGGAARFADALRRRIAQRPVSAGDTPASVTVSVGVAVMRAGEDLDLDGLLARADEALASARAAGGDRIALDRLHGLARIEAPRAPDAREDQSADDAGH
jgi:diguanylate cyclase (GGDEF)-like protein